MDIKLTNIYKKYKEVMVLEDINITFKEGQITCIMGPSGIGKTTLANILLGITKPDQGRIQGIDGRKMAAVFQEDALIEHWDAVKNIQLVCEPTISKEMIEKEFSRIALTDYKGKPVSQLSGGMRRRVAILRALMAESDLIIMDEPFKGLDDELKIIVIDYLKRKTMGKTVLIISHDKDDVERLEGNRVVLD